MEDEDEAFASALEHYLQREEKKEKEKDNPKITFKTEKSVTIETEPERKPEALADVEWRTRLEKFKEFLNVVQGKVDIKRRLDALLNPDKLQTSTRLTGEEIDFVVDAYWLARTYPELFSPLRDFADELMATKISEQGLGRQEAIQFVGAIETTKLFKSVFGMEPEAKKRRSLFRREKKVEE